MKPKDCIVILITPFLATIYPFVYFLSININQFRFSEVGRTFFVLIAFSILIIIFYLIVLKNVEKAAVASAFSGITFLSYGHLFIWLKEFSPAIARTFLWFPAFIILQILLLWVLKKTTTKLVKIFLPINIILGVLILLSLFPIIDYKISSSTYRESYREEQVLITNYKKLPDLYLIILDAYPRNDSLQQKYQFNNSDFEKSLSDMGFFYVPCSQSNYMNTYESVFSMLNLNYLGSLQAGTDTYFSSLTLNDISNGIKDSSLHSQLKEMGYKTVAFDTTFPFTEITNSDIYTRFTFDPSKINNFEFVFRKTTILTAFDTIAQQLGIETSNVTIDPEIGIDNIEESPEYSYVSRVFGLDQLDESIYIRGPKFVFAHLLAVHSPVRFDKHGNFVGNRSITNNDYINSIQYVNERMLSAVIKMLTLSQSDPIIIILSNHGMRNFPDTVFSNFIAVYGPDSIKKQLYDAITPVNVMRLVTSEITDREYDLLPDYSFQQIENKPGYFEIVPNLCNHFEK